MGYMEEAYSRMIRLAGDYRRREAIDVLDRWAESVGLHSASLVDGLPTASEVGSNRWNVCSQEDFEFDPDAGQDWLGTFAEFRGTPITRPNITYNIPMTATDRWQMMVANGEVTTGTTITAEPDTRPRLVVPRGRSFIGTELIDVLTEQGLEYAVEPDWLQKCLEEIKMESDESAKSASDVDTSMLDDFIKSYERR